MKHLTLEQLNGKRDKLMKFSTITEQDIQKTWRQNSEKEYNNEELKELKYSWDLPLFCKIIFRIVCCNYIFFNTTKKFLNSHIIISLILLYDDKNKNKR